MPPYPFGDFGEDEIMVHTGKREISDMTMVCWRDNEYNRKEVEMMTMITLQLLSV